jgi:mannose/fructose/N-acetylgalactosamine-specific phosphotransferase system component IID
MHKFPSSALLMKKTAMLNIFSRSLTVQLSFNFRTMQGIGFSFSMLPLSSDGDLAVRHLRMFSTNPYLAPAIIGSVVKMEEEGGEKNKIENLKNALMGPYAAIGDSFFWGALCLFSSVVGVLLALYGSILAPLAFMFIFTPAQLLVRINGFIKSYVLGVKGFQYIRGLDLPGVSSRLHVGALLAIGLLTAFWIISLNGACGIFLQTHFCRLFVVLVFLISFLGVLRRVSVEKIIYGVALLCVAISY